MNEYHPSNTGGRTRQAHRWSLVQRGVTRASQDIVCTVSEDGGGEVYICSQAEGPCASGAPQDFWGVLRKWERTWMWDNLQWTGEDDWLATAIAEGTCIAVTDGSYVKDLYPSINSAVVVLECTRGRGRVWCSFPEASRAACSYRGELIGLMAIHLILLAINEVNPGLEGSVHIYTLTAWALCTR
jgi:hypothetical protein